MIISKGFIEDIYRLISLFDNWVYFSLRNNLNR